MSEMNDDVVRKLVKQNETIISLLGRVAFKREEVLDIVTRKKQNPQKYVEGYNACDGKHSVTEIASVIGVKQPTVSPILTEWERLGIIYDIDREGGKFYRKIFPI